DPGNGLRALRPVPRRTLRGQAFAEHRLPATGGDVPVARAHGLLATEDRQGIRRPGPHDGDPRDVEDRAADQGRPECVQPCAGVDRAHQAGALISVDPAATASLPGGPAMFSTIRIPCKNGLARPIRDVFPGANSPYVLPRGFLK